MRGWVRVVVRVRVRFRVRFNVSVRVRFSVRVRVRFRVSEKNIEKMCYNYTSSRRKKGWHFNSPFGRR